MKKQYILGRTADQRKALLKNLSMQLVTHKQVTTTLAKAKALRPFVEAILTKSKKDTTHSRRQVFAKFQNKHATKIVFNEIAPRIANRPGGYTRIIRLPRRAGDNASMALIQLVDYAKKQTATAES